MINLKAIAARLPRDPLAAIVRPYLWSVPAIVLLATLASGLESFGIALLIPLIGILLADEQAAALPAPLRAVAALTAPLEPSTRIVAMGALILALVALKGVAQAVNAALMAWVEGSVGHDLRKALADRLLDADYRFFFETNKDRLVAIIVNDSWLAMQAMRSLLTMVPATIGLIVIAAALVWLHAGLALIVAAGGLAIVAVIVLIERVVRRLSREVSRSNELMAGRMLALVNATRAIRMFGQQARESDRFAAASAWVHASTFAGRRGIALLGPSVDAMVSLLFVLILLASFFAAVPVPTATAFLVLLARAQTYARAFSEGRVTLASVQSSLHEVSWLLEQPPAERRPNSSEPELRLDRPIRFERVSFAYPNGHAAIREASFVLEPGIATALIGRSGAGKTTLVNLLCRLIEPEQGTIRLGERAAGEIDPLAWRSRIALAGQDLDLLEGTVRDNIAYGRPDASRDEIELAARTAAAHGFIERLPQGYDTPVGDEAARLSSGQRQRIALARALLVRPDLLILDEATSAVDAISEEEIIALLAEHRHFRTALVISHRRSTLAACQQGIVIEDGVVLESGPLGTLRYYHAMVDAR